jgi:Zn-dependent M28 family amino/carboxypeptidase
MTVTRTLLLAMVLLACGQEQPGVPQQLTTEALQTHIADLAADSMEGRSPSSPGGERTVAYLEREFAAAGLQPGNGESFRQEVPLVSITADPGRAQLLVHGDGGTSRLVYGADYMTWTKRVVESVTVDRAEMVFVGYGIVAPEYGWNDYEGVDARGKTVVMLVNDPGFATQDSTMFTGDAMTYYGRWTYKFEEAARQGAAAALIVHETDAASYPWAVVRGSWAGEQFDLVHSDDNMSRVPVEGWITSETAAMLFGRAGLDYETMNEEATTGEFRARPLRLSASFALRNTLRRSTSNNVIAVFPGTERADEYVLYLAHWDHLGIDTTLEGDQIYNGALDNATGTAGLLLLAEAFAAADPAPKRSVVFLAVTAEEQGLLGSAYYAADPVFPLDHTVAAINMDALNVLGPMRDITVVGLGQSDLDDYVSDAAALQGRAVRPDPDPAAGSYYRSDHFSFAKVGVPALNADGGIDHAERGEAWAREQRDRFEAERYHKPSDEVDDAWDLRGTVEDLHLLFRIGYRLATEESWPNWSPTSEFRARRDSMMAGR